MARHTSGGYDAPCGHPYTEGSGRQGTGGPLEPSTWGHTRIMCKLESEVQTEVGRTTHPVLEDPGLDASERPCSKGPLLRGALAQEDEVGVGPAWRAHVPGCHMTLPLTDRLGLQKKARTPNRTPNRTFRRTDRLGLAGRLRRFGSVFSCCVMLPPQAWRSSSGAMPPGARRCGQATLSPLRPLPPHSHIFVRG
jgi:hypothetical protein